MSIRDKSARSDCSFRLEILYRDNGHQRSVIVDDDGSPFRVVYPVRDRCRPATRPAARGTRRYSAAEMRGPEVALESPGYQRDAEPAGISPPQRPYFNVSPTGFEPALPP
jgi:hypothetical protein